VHPRRDTRIFYRECISSHKKGYETYLIVADGKGDEFFEGIQIIDIGKESSRLKNFFKSFSKLKTRLKELKPDLVHFHDPELMFVGKRINRRGIPVIFDIHENIAVQILDKEYIPKLFRKPASFVYRKIENYLIKHFHLMIAEYSYSDVYEKKGKSMTIVLNMPDISHFNPYIVEDRTGNEIFYIGGISSDRGLEITVDALKILKQRKVDFFMHYIGPISDEKLSTLELSEIEESIKFYGRMDSREGFEISKKCVVGLSVLKPIKNYISSYSTKIFEYMATALPVITSNFPLYVDVVEKYNCGYCIDPFSPKELADRIEELISNQSHAQTLGKNGLTTVTENFNWSKEEKKLLDKYQEILG